MKEENKGLSEEISSLDKVGFDTKGETERSGSFLIADDRPEQSKSMDESLVVLPLSMALSEYPWAEELLFSLVDKDTDRYTKKVARESENLGSFIYVKSGAKIKAPVQSCFFLHNEGFEQVLHNLIVLEPNSKLDIITGCTTGNLVNVGKHFAVTETFVRKNAEVTFTMIHDWGKDTIVYPRTGIKIEEGGSYISNYIALTRVKEIQSNPFAILGENATAKFHSIIYGHSNSLIDMGGRAFLRGDNSSSEIISRVVSRDSRIISRALIEGEGKDTKGHTECNGLLLDEKSSVYTVPELDAKNIDTELSHEASIGKISGEQLNYLMARGLDEDSARALLIRGFLETGISGLPENIQKKVDSMIDKATSGKSA